LNRKLAFHQSLKWIFWSVVLVSGGAFGGVLLWHLKQEKSEEKKYGITQLIQSGSQKEGLPSTYLEHLLNLEKEATYIARSDLQAMQDLLLAQPWIKKAYVTLQIPDTLHIEYTMREAIFLLEDSSGYGVDEEGVYFPLEPFCSYQNLPQVFLGLANQNWEETKDVFLLRVEWAKKLVEALNQKSPSWRVLRLNLSDLYFDHRPVSEAVIELKNRAQGQSLLLRIPGSQWKEALSRWCRLEDSHLLFSSPNNEENRALAIDLRIPELAYVLYEEKER
jgi:cell division septal protein FtsQ